VIEELLAVAVAQIEDYNRISKSFQRRGKFIKFGCTVHT
jgi:hypothetical protein